MVPSLTTAPVAPLRANSDLPAMKLASLWLIVVAVNAPTSSTAFLPKYTPAGLIRVTCPGALILPKI